MITKNIKPAREGWFTLDADNPSLLGSQCSQCQTYYFPKMTGEAQFCRNPACQSETFKDIELSNRGTIWSYTNSFYPPPEPFIAPEPYKVYALAAVQLELEGLVVLGQLASGVSVEDVKIGDEVELTLESLFEDDENNYMVWKWKPLSEGRESGAIA